MNTKKFLIGTLVGGVAFFFLGYLIYGMALTDFFSQHTGTATGVAKPMEELVWWALILGNLASAALLSYIFLKWANISSFGAGASAAAVIGFLIVTSFDFVIFATANISDLTGTAVDIIAYTVMTAIAGGIIGAVLGMVKS